MKNSLVSFFDKDLPLKRMIIESVNDKNSKTSDRLSIYAINLTLILSSIFCMDQFLIDSSQKKLIAKSANMNYFLVNKFIPNSRYLERKCIRIEYYDLNIITLEAKKQLL